jgi:hypothetical protein
MLYNRFILLLGAVLFTALNASAQLSFPGTNAPGQGTNYSFTVSSVATNLSLVISNSSTTYSYLLVKAGGTPTLSNFDFAAELNGQTNEINLESPEFVPGNYGLLVSTPATSTTQGFKVLLTTNQAGLRSAAYPVSKPLVFSTTGFITNSGAGSWNYFQVYFPSNLPSGWRVVLSSTNATTPGLYIKRGQLPTTGTYDQAVGPGQPIDTIIFTSAQATNSTYFIGVYQPAGTPSSANYTLSTELASITTLTWDPGVTDAGTDVYTNQSLTGGDYFFAITTMNTANLVWRTALNVSSNEANLYMLQGSLPSTSSYNFASTRVGSDGFVLAQGQQFSPGQNWYILVHATPGSKWKLVTGQAYVQQLPNLAPDASSGATVTMGAEGIHFFETTISSNTLAWRLYLNGLTNQIYVKQTAAPVPLNTSTYDLTQPSQMLVVPTYLNVGSQYFVSVVGNPGLNFTLDSRQQAVTPMTFNSTSNLVVNGYGYTTYLVQVPVQQIAWQVSVSPISGNANVAVRQNNVPNEFVNDAFSEPPPGIGASVTLVPSTLSNGSFYLTVYSTGAYTVNLFNGQPVITTTNYVFTITNDEPNQVGWRYYTIINTAQQLGSLGWELDLSNAPPGTEIAIRRNAVPGEWNYRNNPYDYYGYSSLGYVDLSSTLGFLQQPNHPADVWYIGVYSPNIALGKFVLSGSQLTGPPVSFDGAGSTNVVSGQLAGKFQYFTVTVPTNAFGWDLRINGATNANPYLYVCRDLLPTETSPPNPNYYYWYEEPTWPSTYQIQAGYDWTGDYYDNNATYRYGQVLEMGMGNPLQAGTYYVGVMSSTGTTPFSYSLVSRGIGTNFTIPIISLPFTNGVITTNLLAREAAYYKIVVPTNLPSWQVELSTNSGEALLMLEENALPNVDAGGYPPYDLYGGRKMEKLGSEQYLMMPPSGQSNIVAGTYYLAVASQGIGESSPYLGTNSTSYTLTSFGPLGVANIGVVDNTGATDILVTNSSQAGQLSAFQFSVPPLTLSMQVSLENIVGDPVLTLRADSQLPGGYDSYGVDGGQGYTWVAPPLINISNPTVTNYTLMVQAVASGGNASYRIRIHAIGPQPVTFDGGTFSITNQPTGVWQYFVINVPPNAFGWDLRINGATNANPYLYVSRDVAPTVSSPLNPNYYYWYEEPTWPSTYQIQAGYDWTGDYYDNDGVYRYGQVLQMGMGNALQAGTYYVGVLSSTGTTPFSYTLESRGIGTNFTLPIVSLPFANGVTTNLTLNGREAAYYSVVVPTNVPGWKVRLSNISGETLLMVQENALPNVVAGGSPSYDLYGGHKMQKAGNEQYVLLPVAGQSNIVAGTYYLAVASEGMNPDSPYLGTNSSAYVLTSYGVQSVSNLGPTSATDILVTNSLQGGENAFYKFSIPPGVLAVEARLDNVTGGPFMTLSTGTNVTQPYYNYGYDGSVGYSWDSSTIITLPNPTPTNYSLTVQASYLSGQIPDAVYTAHIRQMPTPALVFDPTLNSGGSSNVATGTLLDGQSAFYEVTVPATLNGQPIIGWTLSIAETTGTPSIRVRQGALPDSYNYYDGTSPFQTSQYIVVPPYLTPGVWYVEVKGSGITSYTLTSSSLQLNRPAWIMPAVGAPVTTTGLPPAGPLFADTGVDTNGQPLQGLEADQGVDLAQGQFNYYAIIVPTNNTGILRTRLDAISGNPNLYIRAGAASTLSHYQYGNYGSTLYDRSLSASGGSEYGNWVPFNGRFEAALTNGIWYLAVQAGGNSNVRYRLRMDTGIITNLVLNSGNVTNQQMVAGDWLYYAFQIPTNAPVNWNVNFTVQLGSVVMYVRDRVPPGDATTITDYRDWSSGSDNKNQGPYTSYSSPGTYTLTCPPVRPGNTYYLGFRAVNDSTFSLSTSTNGGNIDYTNVIAFYNGYTSNTIPAFGIMKYRVDVPGNGVRWISRSTNASSVWLYLEQGSADTLTTADDWYSINSVNSSLDEYLQTPGNWPWQPGYSYFLAATNTSATPQPFIFVLNGEGPGSGPFGFANVSRVAGGNIQLTMILVPGLAYQLQSSTNFINWTVLNNLAPLSVTNVLQINPIGVPYQFFRIQEQ